MPRQGITAYDLLISCPGDVNKYAEVIKECLEGFCSTEYWVILFVYYTLYYTFSWVFYVNL